jgi:2-dehydro-3-deoxyphosphogluconate aldolase/(4S)-4-hydroxy-2-oxoglutarate aldolase
MTTTVEIRPQVALSLRRSPVVGVVRTASFEEAARQARLFADAGIELVEITFSVPDAARLVREMLARRPQGGPPWIGMGTVTTAGRAHEAVQAGSEFIVTPNVSADVARIVRDAGLYLVLGALTPTEVVLARELGADLVKVYPLPPVGGPHYLSTIRQPLGDIPMLAGGGFSVDEIPAYLRAGAVAFGIGAPLIGADDEESRGRIARALALARTGKEEK